MPPPFHWPPKPPPTWRRHFEGWQILAVAGVISWGAALIVVPRPVVPIDLPKPRLDARAVAEVEAHDRALASSVDASPLDARVRRLGSAVRAVGHDESSADPRLPTAQKDLKTAALEAMKFSVPDVVRLRAFQTEAFLRALASWQQTGAATDEIAELGGTFLSTFESSGWVVDQPHDRAVVMPELALRASYKKRWNDIVGLKAGELELTLEEQRALVGFVLEHPPRPRDRRQGRVTLDTYEDQMRLNKIDELAKLDPSYPALFAKGIVFYRLSAYESAVTAFAQYLEATPDGPYALRAANFLKASLQKAGPLDAF